MKLLFYPATVELEDDQGNHIGGIGRPYNPVSDEDLIKMILNKTNLDGTESVKRRVLDFMVRNAESCRRDETGEINLTTLTELAAEHFNMDSALDDETHWIWEQALKAEEICG